MTELPPRTVAALDQAAATLADLVRSAREHHKQGCDLPAINCPGMPVTIAITTMQYERVEALLGVAVSELARRGLGESVTDPIRLAFPRPAAPIARPDVWVERGRPWWHRRWRWCSGIGEDYTDGWAWTRAGAHRAALVADAVAAGNAARARAEAADG